jgi:PilZ domain
MWERERKARRVPAVEPVSGSFTNGGIHEVSGVTRDVSPAGAFFYCELTPKVGSEIELMFNLPAELVKDSAQVLCRGRVVRVEPTGGSSKVGVAVEFETIERLPSSWSRSATFLFVLFRRVFQQVLCDLVELDFVRRHVVPEFLPELLLEIAQVREWRATRNFLHCGTDAAVIAKDSPSPPALRGSGASTCA